MTNRGAEHGVESPASLPLLEVRNLTIRFGGITAVDNLSFSVPQGTILGLIGPNGAGKTTVFNVISGIYSPSEGEILFDGENIAAIKPFKINRKGIARTFQNIRLFQSLSVFENICAGGLGAKNTHSNSQTLELLDFVGLTDAARLRAVELPYGQQRKLEIARALATCPKLLLLDEPAAGMNYGEKEDLRGLIQKIRHHFKIPVLIIEHDMRLVMKVCESIVVLDFGEKIAEGDPGMICTDERVVKAYLGNVDGEGKGQSAFSQCC